MNPRLLVINGPRSRATCAIEDKQFSIGRDPQNHLSVPDPSVSRAHCVIARQGDGFIIRDLDSHNGTLVNDLPTSNQLLAHRDYITIGGTVLQFLTEDDLVFEDPAEFATVSLPADPSSPLTTQLATTDLHALLRVSTMLHSFHAMYRGRCSSARNLLERHLLSLILEVIPATRGAILLYEDSLDEPSSSSVKENEADVHRPLAISPKLVKRVLTEGCGLFVEDVSQLTDGVGGKGLQSLLAPLLIRLQACGLIYLEGTAFRETHLHLLVAIAQFASMAMENAFQLEWLETEQKRLEAELYPDHHMIGDSPALRELQHNILPAAKANSTILITGETGTGKELVARAVHRNSPRAGQLFMAVNCAALADALLESELFGHEKGAFTGAFAQKKGRLEVSAGGTVFLDEIGEMPLQLQAKLLRVLQERQMERVGGTQPIKLDIRLIAATNRNLEEEVRAGRFRQDLFFRLNVVTLKTPPLRERPVDIPPLAKHFASKFGAQCGRRISGISPEAEAYLVHYRWPGNIRELENALERAVVLGLSDIIQLEDLPDSVREIARPAEVVRAPGLQDAVDRAKREAIEVAFQQTRNDHAGAAKMLGVHPNYLYRLMRNLGMR